MGYKRNGKQATFISFSSGYSPSNPCFIPEQGLDKSQINKYLTIAQWSIEGLQMMATKAKLMSMLVICFVKTVAHPDQVLLGSALLCEMCL